MDLNEAIRATELETLEKELSELKLRMKDVWTQHLKISEDASLNLQRLSELECKINELKK
jgi:hypothetical protein